jgi:hypothetical protein
MWCFFFAEDPPAAARESDWLIDWLFEAVRQRIDQSTNQSIENSGRAGEAFLFGFGSSARATCSCGNGVERGNRKTVRSRGFGCELLFKV